MVDLKTLFIVAIAHCGMPIFLLYGHSQLENPEQCIELHYKDWENWKDDDVTQLIHQYWIQSPYELDHRKTLVQLVKDLYMPHETFLEAGCGTGLIYQQLVPHVMKNQCYIGIDITQNMLDIAHQDYPEGLFLWGDLYRLSFADKSVEIVAAFEVLGHLPHIDIPIREMCRVASRLVLFTVWINHSKSISEERFRNSRFIHIAYSHADVLKIIENVLKENYTVKTIPLSKNTAAYIISF